jgi:cysteinyl-tRNA synthetase
MHAAATLANKLLDEGKGIDKAMRRRTLARLGKDLREVGAAIGVFTQEPHAYLTERRKRLVELKRIDVGAVQAKLAERTAARTAKDFNRADAIRGELAALGVAVHDTPSGSDWSVQD